MKGPSPLLGYNNNVRHKGRVFHIQTEDSGIRHPHVITHLFMDGGRIVKTLKTSYAQHLEDENGHEHVRALMKQQHQAMFRDLRDGKFDYALAPAGGPPSSGTQGPASVAPSSIVPKTVSSQNLTAVSSQTEPNFPAQGEDAAPVTVASPSQTNLAAVPVGNVPVPVHRVTDPSAQTMPDLRAVRNEPPAPQVVDAPAAAAPPAPAVAVATAVATDKAPTRAEEREPSAGDPAAYDAIEDYDPGLSSTRRRTPVPGSDMPPPPLAMLSKARPDGVYRSQGTTPTPPPPPPARAALGSSPGGRGGVASRPPVGSPVSQSTRPQSRRSLFGEDYVSEKSLDEVILSYLAEDLDTDK